MAHGGIFWGIFLILFGVSILFKAIFGFSLPFAKIIVSFMFIYIGISLLTNNFCIFFKKTNKDCAKNEKCCSIFGGKQTIDTPENVKTLLGRSVIDLTHMSEPAEPITIDVDTIFGYTLLKINPHMPILIKGKAVFGSIEFPNDTIISIGSHAYTTASADKAPVLIINAQVIFGSLKVETV
jgi:hypothetical protein